VFWENFRTLYYLTKYKNIKSASFFLNIHPSTITRRISQLEKQFNQKLFINYKDIILSEFGEKIIDYLYVSSEHFEKLEDKNLNIENLYKNHQFIIYMTDVYYYNVLIYLYEENLLCKNFFSIRYISVIGYDVLNNLINTNSNNFVYITGDPEVFKDHSDYMTLPIYDIPIYLYKNLDVDNNHVISYSGEEKWLKDLYKNYDYKDKIINYSNSIHILSKMIYCVNEGILPKIFTKLNKCFQKTKIGDCKLMLVFNKNNMALQKFFAFNALKNN
jgi:hypothetical protein